MAKRMDNIVRFGMAFGRPLRSSFSNLSSTPASAISMISSVMCSEAGWVSYYIEAL